jgi:hypothetical protein
MVSAHMRDPRPAVATLAMSCQQLRAARKRTLAMIMAKAWGVDLFCVPRSGRWGKYHYPSQKQTQLLAEADKLPQTAVAKKFRDDSAPVTDLVPKCAEMAGGPSCSVANASPFTLR